MRETNHAFSWIVYKNHNRIYFQYHFESILECVLCSVVICICEIDTIVEFQSMRQAYLGWREKKTSDFMIVSFHRVINKLWYSRVYIQTFLSHSYSNSHQFISRTGNIQCISCTFNEPNAVTVLIVQNWNIELNNEKHCPHMKKKMLNTWTKSWLLYFDLSFSCSLMWNEKRQKRMYSFVVCVCSE